MPGAPPGGVRGPARVVDAVLFCRIYKEDTKAQLGVRELVEWFEWMAYAGVEHVYLYDTRWPDRPEEALDTDPHVREFIETGFVTYHDWSQVGWRGDHKQQLSAYADAGRRYPHAARWRLALDMDEYPHIPADAERGFLARWLEALGDGVGLVFLTNAVYGGNHTGLARVDDMRVARYHFYTMENARLRKFCIRPGYATNYGMHGASVGGGMRTAPTAPREEVRMHHMVGPRSPTKNSWGGPGQKHPRWAEDASADPVATKVRAASEGGQLFPGIDMAAMRRRLLAEWPFRAAVGEFGRIPDE